MWRPQCISSASAPVAYEPCGPRVPDVRTGYPICGTGYPIARRPDVRGTDLRQLGSSLHGLPGCRLCALACYVVVGQMIVNLARLRGINGRRDPRSRENSEPPPSYNIAQLASSTYNRNTKTHTCFYRTYLHGQHVDPRPQPTVAGPERRQEGRAVDRRRVGKPPPAASFV